MLGIIQKSAAEQLDYDIDFSLWMSDGDVLQSAAVAITPSDGSLAVQSYEINGSVVKVWLSGGDPGLSYNVAVTVATAAGRIKEACFKIRVRGC
ncbi:virion associated protein [Ralstonia phage UAM5]|nr:virion associated protein [Ralstonia phage UAM5]